MRAAAVISAVGGGEKGELRLEARGRSEGGGDAWGTFSLEIGNRGQLEYASPLLTLTPINKLFTFSGMIASFADKESAKLFTTGKSKKLPPDVISRATMRLTQLDSAREVTDLLMPPSNRLEALSGKRAGQWSIRINDQWRICFSFANGEATAVEITTTKRYLTMITNGLPPIHPGVFLKEILDELHVSQNAFAKAIGVSPMRVSHVIKGTRPVTAELALLFGKAFNQTPTYWMNLQTSYDLKTAEKELAVKVRQVHPLSQAA